MTEHKMHNHDGRDDHGEDFAMPHDDLDALLRTWHDDNALRAQSRRAEVLRAIRAETTAGSLAGGEGVEDGVPRMDIDAAHNDGASIPSPALGGRVRVGADDCVLAERASRTNLTHPHPGPLPKGEGAGARSRFVFRRYTALAASLMVLVAIGALLIPHPESRAFADLSEIMVPDGGKLEAMDELDRVIGPCPLKHTDVDVRVAGRFTRVTVTQQYHNPYDRKIEAVYTFPLSHRSAVDRMTMTIGDRVVIGEVKERRQARQIYEAARQQGHVASLLEQERPNIFTQSVANIEPGAQVDIEISYVETLESADGIYTFDFPMVVGPRYIPGASNSSGVLLPAEMIERGGAVLMGPGQFAIANDAEGIDHETHGTLQPGKLKALLHAAHGIEFPGQTWWGLAPEAPADEPQDANSLRDDEDDKTVPTGEESDDVAPPATEEVQDNDQFIILRDELGREVARIPIIQIVPQWPQQFPPQPQIPSPFIVPGQDGQPITVTPSKPLPVLNMPARWSSFTVTYTDGTSEDGEIFVDGTGHINGRWFFTDPALAEGVGTGYAPNTDQVPDASRITPMPVRPPSRAGHDINVTVHIDTGGPGIEWIKSDLHDIDGDEAVLRAAAPPRAVDLRLANAKEIPNRDFVLSWRLEDDTIEESTFAHFGEYGDWSGGFFTLVLAPPARVEDAQVRSRELIFVLDTSGSMSGYPVEKGKEVMAKAIDAMRPGDTFNLITFAGDTHILWPAPRPNTEQNRAAAQAFLASREGGGGTEMMKAIDAALRPQIVNRADKPLTLNQLFDLPADERNVTVAIGLDQFKLLGMDRNNFGKLTLRDDVTANWAAATTGERILEPIADIHEDPNARAIIATGTWRTFEGQRLLQVDSFAKSNDFPGEQPLPMRIVMFLTDGFVGNDDAIISAVQEHAKTTRVFSFGIGNSVNRHLLDNMARAGRGEAEFVLIETDADPAVERFARRIATPVLTDIVLDFDGIEVLDTIPSADFVPDLFDERPLIIHGRYTKPGEGTLRITGMTAAGRYEREMPVVLPAANVGGQNDVLGKLWARANIDEMTRIEETPDMRPRIVALGEAFQIMTKHTSFVAVDHSRLTVGGQPLLVPVPIELPDKVSWEGNFGGLDANAVVDDVVAQLATHADFSVIDRMQATLKFAAKLPANGFDTDAAKQEFITENLRDIRQFQLEMRYPEALEVIDEILFIEPANPGALVLRDSIRTAQLYQEYARTSGIKASREPRLSSVQRSMIPDSYSNATTMELGTLAFRTTAVVTDLPSIELIAGVSPEVLAGVKVNTITADSFGLVMPNSGTDAYAGFQATTGGEWGEAINGVYGRGYQPQVLMGDVPIIGPAFRNEAGVAHYFEANQNVELQQQAATEYLYSLQHANTETLATELSAQLQQQQIQLRVDGLNKVAAVDRRVRGLSEELSAAEALTDRFAPYVMQQPVQENSKSSATGPTGDPNAAVTGGGGFGGGGGGGGMHFPWQQDKRSPETGLVGRFRVVPIVRAQQAAVLAPLASRAAIRAAVEAINSNGVVTGIEGNDGQTTGLPLVVRADVLPELATQLSQQTDSPYTGQDEASAIEWLNDNLESVFPDQKSLTNEGRRTPTPIDCDVDLVVTDAPHEDVFKSLSDQCAANIIFSKQLTGDITAAMEDVSLDDALAEVARQLNARIYRETIFYYVVTPEEFDQWAKENPVRAAAMEASDNAADETAKTAKSFDLPAELEEAITAQLDKAMQGRRIRPPLKVGGFDPALLDEPLREKYDAWLSEQLKGTPFSKAAEDPVVIITQDETIDITDTDGWTSGNMVLAKLGERHKFNLIASKSISLPDQVDENILELPLDEALDALFLPRGHRWIREDNFVYVLTDEEFAEYESNRAEAELEAILNAPLPDDPVDRLAAQIKRMTLLDAKMRAALGESVAATEPGDAIKFFELADFSIPMNYKDNSLESVASFIGQVTGINVYVDWAQLEQIGLTRDTLVTLAGKGDERGDKHLDQLMAHLASDAGTPAWTKMEDSIVFSTVDGFDVLEQRIAASQEAERQAADALRRQKARESNFVVRLYGPNLPAEFAEQVLVLTGQLVERGHIDAAAHFAAGASELWPDDPLVTAMRDAVANEVLTDEQRVKTVRAIALRARQIIVGRIVEVKRAARIKAVVDPRLAGGDPAAGKMPTAGNADSQTGKPSPQPLSQGERGLTKPSPQPLSHGERGLTKPSPPAPLPKGEGSQGILVSVLLESLDREVIDAIEGAGLTVVDRDESRRFVIGRIARENIDDLAVVPPVRKIEPVG